jgi:hypothetical protein
MVAYIGWANTCAAQHGGGSGSSAKDVGVQAASIRGTIDYM